MESTDVLVIGSGIAGLCAAIEAARAGVTVTVASAGKTMSGSSFFPGTWGLGLIGPVNEDDEQDLIDTIQTVGGGVADDDLDLRTVQVRQAGRGGEGQVIIGLVVDDVCNLLAALEQFFAVGGTGTGNS